MSQPQNTFKLNDGIHHIPMIGLGTFNGTKQGEVGNAVKVALKSGYRHIDGAAFYSNEKEIGHSLKEVFAEGEIKREDIFYVSKLWNSCHRASLVRKHCEKTLEDLGLEYLDLYLIHWPIAFENADPSGLTTESLKDEKGYPIIAPISIRETWQEMEKLVENGLVKSIGVSNFNVQNLLDLLTYAKIKPAVNQVELHPYLSQPNLKDFCDRHGIILTAYSPLGQGKCDLLTNELLKSIADKHNKTIANIIFKWLCQRGIVTIPKSSNPSRIIENFNIFDFQLSNDDMEKINSLNSNLRTCSPTRMWNIPLFD
ncbi:hypothetical protein RB653_007593 [Dictyostelium firmibasis]|uniref:aldose reductase n=1 Tax=Dictyostelium firmibasis TaxID=79012 RepID=A0AAN7TNZ4_9MYCE